MPDPDDWNGYRRQVLSEIDRFNKAAEEINTRINQLQIDVALLKFQALIIATTVGTIVPLVVTVTLKFLGH